MKAPANFPTSGTNTSPRIVPAGRPVKDRSKYKPAEAKNSGTKKPSEALRMPGMMSSRTAWESPDRAAPKSSAPMVPCSPIFSAPTTTSKRPPISRPNESWGTLRMRCRKTITTGSTLADSSQATTTKATILPRSTNTGDCVHVVVQVAEGEAHDEQGGDLGDYHDGEDLQPYGLLERSGVRQDLGRQPEARERQNAGQRQRLVKLEAQTQVDAEDVRCDGESRHQRHDHRDDGRCEVPAPDGRHEARNVDLVETDDEEEHEDADLQEQLEVMGRLHQPGGGTENHACQR